MLVLFALPLTESPAASAGAPHACSGNDGGGGGGVAFCSGGRGSRKLLALQNFGAAPSPRALKLKAGATALGTALRQNVLSFLLTAKAKAPPPPRPPLPPPPPVVAAAAPAPAPAPAATGASTTTLQLPAGLPAGQQIVVQTSTPVSINNPINIDAGATQTNSQQQSGGSSGGGGLFSRIGGGGGGGGGPRVVIVPVFIGR